MGPGHGISLVACKDGWVAAAAVSVMGQVRWNEEEPLLAVARHNGGLIPGVLSTITGACYIPWGGKAIPKAQYYVLSNPGGVELVWLRGSGGCVPQGALEGGYTEDGEVLYFGRFHHGGSLICGKVHPSHKVCYIPFCGTEVSQSRYEVLCLRSVPLANLGFQ